jgi:hypothetical protein
MEKINNIKIQVLKNKNKDKKFVHKELFNEQYPFIYISSKKNSGKSNLIYNILINMALPKKTKIYLFSKTYENDQTTINMIDKISKYNDIEFFDDLEYVNQSGEKYRNILDKLISDIKQDIAENKDKLKKLHYTYPRHIFIFDDFSELLKDKVLEGIIKRHRHYLTSFIISSQSYTDLGPNVRNQVNFLILFKEIPINRLKLIYDEKIKGIEWDKFYDCYLKATDQKYNFLLLNCDDNKDIRINFDLKFIL